MKLIIDVFKYFFAWTAFLGLSVYLGQFWIMSVEKGIFWIILIPLILALFTKYYFVSKEKDGANTK